MAQFMIQNSAQVLTQAPVETVMRDELAHGDALLGTIAPILRHLLANDDHSLFSDEIIARVRGMMVDLARQLLDALNAAEELEPGTDHLADQRDNLVTAFVSHSGLLAHVHALALEWQLTERLSARLGLDPVLSPLLQALIAAPEPATAGTAMALLAAQARYAQNQRRMQLPLAELPGDLLHAAIATMQAAAGERTDLAAAAEARIRADYDESRGRLGLIARLITGMGGGAMAALNVAHAGTAMFLSAMALASGQERDLAVLSTNEGQLARLALALRATGLKPEAIEEQFMSLHPEIALPDGFSGLGSDRAAALLARSAVVVGG